MSAEKCTVVLAEAFADAAEYITTRGHLKHAMGERENGTSCCMIGALPRLSMRVRAVTGSGAVHAFMAQAILDLYDYSVNMEGDPHVGLWNDYYDTTAEMVVAALRHASKLALASSGVPSDH